MIPTLTIGNATIYQGNNLDVLPTLPDNSVDAIVCDPPYELGFMGKSWDSSGIAYSVELWRECLRVLKPGGHLLAFGGTRTWHRLAVAIEDAGFEIRDNIAWLYGSGFPKSHNISKAIDKLHGAERTVVGKGQFDSRRPKASAETNIEGAEFGFGAGHEITAPATDDAKKWDGWGTALKPAHEPIVVARKPVEGTVANNVLTYGVGALNIDATRIGANGATQKIEPDKNSATQNAYGTGLNGGTVSQLNIGRWPANIILDEFTAELLDEQSGLVKGGVWNNTTGARHFNNDGKPTDYVSKGADKTVGGASRFFYVAKANKRDRNEGLENIEGQEISSKGNGLARTCNTCGASTLDGCDCPDRTFSNPVRQNFHPTVKPTALMQYLIRLVTPEGGVVLDPFAGSGSTGKAAILENKKFIGIELTADYLPIIEGRLQHAVETMNTQGDDLFE
jgi:site-specific DNA-methyltransferase (adenine-specific)